MRIVAHRQYCLTLLPEDHELYDVFLVQVLYVGGNRWAVRRDGFCLNSLEDWDFEPTNSVRSEQWLATHRFDEHTALMLASRALLRHTVANKTAKEWVGVRR